MPTTSDELPYDHRTAERAFEQTRSARSAYAPAALPPIEPVKIASFLLGHAHRIRESGVAEKLARIPAEFLEPDAPGRIETSAWGLWFSHNSWLGERSGKTEARVRASTLQDATELKRTMMKVATFALDDDPRAFAELASIKSGSGHGDLSSDLARLARVYERYATELKSTGPRYRAADARRARALSAAILAELGEGGPDAETTWREETSRAFQLAEETWDRARAFLHAIDFEDGAQRYPSLWTLRPTRPAARPEAGTDTEGGEEPVEEEKTE